MTLRNNCSVGSTYVYLLRLGFIFITKMCENPYANSAASLREARRRKILENSAHRLKLIEGLSSSSIRNSTESFPELKPEPEVKKPSNTDISKPELNSKLSEILKSKELNEISDFLLRGSGKEITNDVGVEEQVREVEEEEGAEIETPAGNPFLNDFVQKRLHYVFLAIVINILFFLNAGFLFYDNVFCPFYTVKVIEFISRREDHQVFPPVLYLLVIGLPKNAQKITKIVLTLLITLFSDLCLYLFTFIIGTKIINSQQ